MNVTIFPPQKLDWKNNETDEKIRNQFSIFLAGTIDMGNSINWQKQITDELSTDFDDLTFYNPRRPDWNSEWKQTISDVHFNEQVRWEIGNLQNVDLIVMYLAENSKSPISLLELGMFSNRKMIVFCSKDFYRRGNVEIVCDIFKIPLFDDKITFKEKVISHITLNKK
jgi:hypothetical protein